MDVDLEDRLLFGLPPLRLGYVGIAAVVALAAWRGVPVAGGPIAVLVAAIGAVFGWGQWRGRGPDHWLVAATLWVLRARRLELTRPRVVPKIGRRPRLAQRRPLLPPRAPATIHVLHVVGDGEGDP